MEFQSSLKCVCVGDGAVGKTSLLISYTQNEFPDDYVPTVFDNYNATLLYNNQYLNLGLWDTAGQEDYDRLRPLSYPETHVFLVCFSVVEPETFDNVSSKWVPEIKEYTKDVPIVLCGTKVDLRDDSAVVRELSERAQEPITKTQGSKLAKQLGCEYVECSALTQYAVKDVFSKCVEAVFERPGQKKQRKKPFECLKTLFSCFVGL